MSGSGTIANVNAGASAGPSATKPKSSTGTTPVKSKAKEKMSGGPPSAAMDQQGGDDDHGMDLDGEDSEYALARHPQDGPVDDEEMAATHGHTVSFGDEHGETQEEEEEEEEGEEGGHEAEDDEAELSILEDKLLLEEAEMMRDSRGLDDNNPTAEI